MLSDYFLSPVYDLAKENSHFVTTLFFVWFLWWGKRENLVSYNIIFCMLPMMEQEEKLVLWYNYFLYVVYDEAREKTHSVKTLFLVCCWWQTNKKIWFCCHIIFCMLSLMKLEKILILQQLYFLYVVYDVAREKTDSAITLFFLCCVWWSNRKNSFCYNNLFCIFSMMEEDKKLILLEHSFFDFVYDGARVKIYSFRTLSFLCFLSWSMRKNSFCYNFIFCMLSMMQQKKKLLLA